MIKAEELAKRRGGRAVVSDDHAAGGDLVNVPSPAAVIGLRDALTGEARATRLRQLTAPSWLSTRTKPVVERRAAPAPAARETVVRTASSTWSPLPRPEVVGFSRLRSVLVPS